MRTTFCVGSAGRPCGSLRLVSGVCRRQLRQERQGLHDPRVRAGSHEPGHERGLEPVAVCHAAALVDVGDPGGLEVEAQPAGRLVLEGAGERERRGTREPVSQVGG